MIVSFIAHSGDLQHAYKPQHEVATGVTKMSKLQCDWNQKMHTQCALHPKTVAGFPLRLDSLDSLNNVFTTPEFGERSDA